MVDGGIPPPTRAPGPAVLTARLRIPIGWRRFPSRRPLHDVAPEPLGKTRSGPSRQASPVAAGRRDIDARRSAGRAERPLAAPAADRLRRGEQRLRPYAACVEAAVPFVSDEYNGKNEDPDGSLRPRHRRKFDSLWEATVENSVSRVFLGVHWRFDGISVKDSGGNAATGTPAKPDELGPIGGVWLGREIANALMATGLKRA